MYWKILGEAIFQALLLHSLSLRVAGYTVTAADSGGAPVHFTFASLAHAVQMIESGQEGDATVGDLVISVVKTA